MAKYGKERQKRNAKAQLASVVVLMGFSVCGLCSTGYSRSIALLDSVGNVFILEIERRNIRRLGVLPDFVVNHGTIVEIRYFDDANTFFLLHAPLGTRYLDRDLYRIDYNSSAFRFQGVPVAISEECVLLVSDRNNIYLTYQRKADGTDVRVLTISSSTNAILNEFPVPVGRSIYDQITLNENGNLLYFTYTGRIQSLNLSTGALHGHAGIHIENKRHAVLGMTQDSFMILHLIERNPEETDPNLAVPNANIVFLDNESGEIVSVHEFHEADYPRIDCTSYARHIVCERYIWEVGPANTRARRYSNEVIVFDSKGEIVRTLQYGENEFLRIYDWGIVIIPDSLDDNELRGQFREGRSADTQWDYPKHDLLEAIEIIGFD